MALTNDQVRAAIQHVKNPKASKSLTEMGFIKEVKCEGEFVQVVVALPEAANDQKDAITASMNEAIAAAEGGQDAKVTVSYMPAEEKLLPGIKHVILVASGKGGVGKSTVSVNLAYALKHQGHSVGLIDADIYGPSVPMMLHMERPKMTENENGKPIPPTVGGIPVMSIGFFVDPGQGVIWRGPMLHGALKQFFGDFEWGELDYMIIDLPPGTGDVQISISHLLDHPSAVLVTTPQNVALADVTRAHNMFQKVNIDVVGLVENMSTLSARTTTRNTPSLVRVAEKSLQTRWASRFWEPYPSSPRWLKPATQAGPSCCRKPTPRLRSVFLSWRTSWQKLWNITHRPLPPKTDAAGVRAVAVNTGKLLPGTQPNRSLIVDRF